MLHRGKMSEEFEIQPPGLHRVTDIRHSSNISTIHTDSWILSKLLRMLKETQVDFD